MSRNAATIVICDDCLCRETINATVSEEVDTILIRRGWEVNGLRHEDICPKCRLKHAVIEDGYGHAGRLNSYGR